MMTEALVQNNADLLQSACQGLTALVQNTIQQGLAVHELEAAVWQQVLRLGAAALQCFFDRQGTGDVGPTAVLPNGSVVQRLSQTRTRSYMSIFGPFQIERTVYGTRDKQAIELVPLDERLGLPEEKFSYLLQNWSEMLGVEQPFGQVREVLKQILNIDISVDSLERISRAMARDVSDFRRERPTPPAEEEGEMFVASGDGKGIPIRRQETGTQEAPTRSAELPDHHPQTGPKPGRKQMAIVGTVYSVDRYRRTPEQVLEALFHQPGTRSETPNDRPRPCHKHVWASLTFEKDGHELTGTHSTFAWMANQLDVRNPSSKRPVVCVMDGQESLWDAADIHLPSQNRVDILDLLHAIQRVWQAAHVFYANGSDEAEDFARERILRILRGQVGGVIQGFRKLATTRRLGRTSRATIEKICQYFENNKDRMRYDEYLAKGYPIASGAVEGACRHLVKDRLERTGMRWTKNGAQAMLDLRSTWINGDWTVYQEFRIAREMRRLHPYRKTLSKTLETLVAA